MQLRNELQTRRPSVAFGLMMGVSLLALAGCVSASSGVAEKAALTPDTSAGLSLTEEEAAALATPAEPSAETTSTVPTAARETAAMADTGPAQDMAGDGNVVMQGTSIQAGSKSIFASAPAADAGGAVSDPSSVPAYVPVPKLNPAAGSIYKMDAEGASADPAAVVNDQATRSLTLPAQSQQQASTEAKALPEETAAEIAEDEMSSEELAVALAGVNPADQDRNVVAQATQPAKKTLTLASLFGSRKKVPTAAIETAYAGQSNSAAMASIAAMDRTGDNADGLPGVNDDMVDDDKPAGLMKLASLSGLSRVAPNGLLIQTENVDVSCFKPDLMGMIKTVERHYGRRVMVTSGYRDPGHNRRVGGSGHSRHTTCDAADIQIEGVGKWELADYLRSLDNRGGVGTYCYTESVHIDTGTPRDWNWRCRRKKRS